MTPQPGQSCLGVSDLKITQSHQHLRGLEARFTASYLSSTDEKKFLEMNRHYPTSHAHAE